jgi:uncharacterized protein YdaU (DUF1376 family)
MAAKSKNNAWMPLYIGDYLADTMHLNAQQHGAYLLLLMHHWRIGPLPKCEVQLSSISRVDLPTWRKSVWPVIGAFFNETEAGLTQKRLEQERKHVADIKQKRSKVGSEGAAKRWQTDSNCHPFATDGPMAKNGYLTATVTAGFASRAGASAPAREAAAARFLDPPQIVPDRETGEPTVRGTLLNVAGAMVLDAARINSSAWTGDFRPLAAWLHAGFETEDIVTEIRRKAASPNYSPPRSLAYFDAAIRERCKAVAS